MVLQMREEDLVRALQGSFSPDAGMRAECERFLAGAESQRGYVEQLMMVMSRAGVYPGEARQAAGVCLKNAVKKNWSRSVAYDGTIVERSEPLPTSELADTEKEYFKTNVFLLLKALLAENGSSNVLVSTVVETMKQVLQRDFPAKWPQLYDVVLGALKTGVISGGGAEGIQTMHAALVGARLMARDFEMKTRGVGKEFIERLVNELLPFVLQIARQTILIVQQQGGTVQTELAMLRLCMKTYYSCVFVELPRPEVYSAWLDVVLGAIVATGAGGAVGSEGAEKVQKWALRVLQKAVAKTAATPTLASWTKVDVLVGVLVEALQKKQVYGGVNMNIVLSILSEGVQQSVTFKQMKPHLEMILFHVVFPLLCFNQDKQELWSSDPEEYVRAEFSVQIETFQADATAAAVDFVRTIVRLRSREVLFPLLKFCEGVFERGLAAVTAGGVALEAGTSVVVQYDGALGILGCLADHLCTLAAKKPKKKKTTGADVIGERELLTLLSRYVVPVLGSPLGFVRFRGLAVLGEFLSSGELNFSGSSEARYLLVQGVFGGIKQLLSDRELPVRVQAGVVLRNALDQELLEEAIKQCIPELLEKLLGVMNEVECESLASTLEVLVDGHSEAVLPFAAQAVAQLSKQFVKILQAGEGCDDEGGMVAMGILQTVTSILDAAGVAVDGGDGSQQRSGAAVNFVGLEMACLPILEAVISDDGSEYLQEGLEILSYLSFYGERPLSPALWRLFDRLYEGVMEGNRWGKDWLDEMFNVLDNYISRGGEVFVRGRSASRQSAPFLYSEMLYAMVEAGLNDSDYEENNVAALRIGACIFESVRPVENVRVFVPVYLALFSKKYLQVSAAAPGDSTTKRWLMYAFACMVVADVDGVVASLGGEAAVMQFCGLLVDNAKLFKNPDERKVHILALSTVLNLLTRVAGGEGLLRRVVETLAWQTKQIVEVRKKIEEGREEEDDEEEEEDDELEDLDEDEDAKNVEDTDVYKKYKEILAKLSVDSADDDGNTSEAYSLDDFERETALDEFDEFTVVLEVLKKIPESTLLGCLPQSDLAMWHNFLVANQGKKA